MTGQGDGFGVRSSRVDRHFIDGNIDVAATAAGQWLAFGGAIRHISSTSILKTSVSSVDLAVTSTGTNLLIVWLSCYIGSDTALSIQSITDSSSGTNVWNYSTAPSNQSPPANGSFFTTGGYYGFAAAAWCEPVVPVTSITVTMSNVCANFYMGVEEFTNLPAGYTIDGSSSTANGGAVETTISGAVITSSNTGDAQVFVTANGSGYTSATTGWALVGASGSNVAAWNVQAPGTPGYNSVVLGGPSQDCEATVFLSIGVPVYATPQPLVLQTAQNSAASGSAVTVTLPNQTGSLLPGVSTCLVVVVKTDNVTTNATVSGITLGGVADNFGSLISFGTGAGADIISFWADPGCATGQTSIVVSTTGGVGTQFTSVTVYEAAYLQPTLGALLDQSAGNSSTTNALTWSSGSSPATTMASELWIGLGSNNSASTIAGPPAPWTNLAPNGTVLCVSGYKVTTASDAAFYAGTASPTGHWGAAVICLRSAGPYMVQSVSGNVNASSLSLNLPHPTKSGNTLIASILGNGSSSNPTISGIVAGGAAVRSSSPYSSGAALTSSAVFTKPAGTVTGDLLIAYFSGSGVMVSGGITAPVGWSTLYAPTSGTFSDDNYAAYTKVAGGSEPSTYTFTPGTACVIAAVMIAVMNTSGTIRTGNRVDQASATGATFTSTALSGTQPTDLTLVLGFMGDDAGTNSTETPPGSPWTPIANVVADFPSGPSCHAAVCAFAGGAEAAGATFTSTSTTAVWGVISVAVEGTTAADNFASVVTAGTLTFTTGAIWADPGCAGSQNAIVISSTGGSGTITIAAFVEEWWGLETTAPSDQTANNASGSTGLSWSSGSTAALSQASEVAIGLDCGSETSLLILGPPAPWVSFAQIGTTGTGLLITGSNIVNTGAAQTYQGIYSVPSAFTAIVATFKVASTVSAQPLVAISVRRPQALVRLQRRQVQFPPAAVRAAPAPLQNQQRRAQPLDIRHTRQQRQLPPAVITTVVRAPLAPSRNVRRDAAYVTRRPARQVLPPPGLPPAGLPVRARFQGWLRSQRRIQQPSRLAVSGPALPSGRQGGRPRVVTWLRNRQARQLPPPLAVSGPLFPPARAGGRPRLVTWTRWRPARQLPPPLAESGPVLPVQRQGARPRLVPWVRLQRRVSGLPGAVQTPPGQPRRARLAFLRTRTQSQLTPSQVVVPPAVLTPSSLPPKARWLGWRTRNQTQLPISAAAPPPVATQLGGQQGARARLTVFRPRSRVQQPPVTRPVLVVQPQRRKVIGLRVRSARLTPVFHGNPALPVQGPKQRRLVLLRTRSQRGMVTPPRTVPAVPGQRRRLMPLRLRTSRPAVVVPRPVVVQPPVQRARYQLALSLRRQRGIVPPVPPQVVAGVSRPSVLRRLFPWLKRRTSQIPVPLPATVKQGSGSWSSGSVMGITATGGPTLESLWAIYLALRAQADSAAVQWREVMQSAGWQFAPPFYSRAFQLYQQADQAYNNWLTLWLTINPAPPPGPPPPPFGLQ